MKEDFRILLKWIPDSSIEQEDIQAKVQIHLSDKCLTRHHSTIDNSDSDAAVLAPFPMAMWFASNWWRLCWEPTPNKTPTTDWRMSHMLSAAGYGYTWPTICFQTDGELIRITSLPNEIKWGETASYTTRYSGLITQNLFENTIHSFINECISKVNVKELKDLWVEVCEERENPQISFYRKIEAILGFDPGEGPEDEILSLLDRAEEYGTDALQEISSQLVSSIAVQEAINNLKGGQIGAKVSIADTAPLVDFAKKNRMKLFPWDLGFALAREARKLWGISGPLLNETLYEIMGIPSNSFDVAPNIAPDIGLGWKSPDNTIQFCMNRSNRPAQRFMASRLICENLAAPSTDLLLPSTNQKTARQKVQRAFAAELLCPIQKILEYCDGDYSDDILDEVANIFDVSSLVVRSQLSNRNIIMRDEEPRNIWFDAAENAC